LKERLPLNLNLTKTEVVQFIYKLRKDRTNITTLFQPQFRALLHFIYPQDGYVYIQRTPIINLQFYDDFIRFLNVNFKGELEAYVINCFNQEHYLNLHALLCYQRVLNSDLLKIITERLKERLSAFIETFNLIPVDYETKTLATTNPYFYRCLNQIGPEQFEADIILLINAAFLKCDDKRWSARIFFAIGIFRSDSFEFTFRLEKCVDYEKREPVWEIRYPPGTAIGRGGTTHDPPESGKPVNASTKKRRADFHTLIAFVGIALTLSTILINSMPPPKSDFEVRAEEISSQLPPLDKLYLNLDQSVVEKIEYLNSDNLSIIQQEDIEFNIENTNLPRNQGFIDEQINVEVKNTTDRELVLITQPFGGFKVVYYFVSPHESIIIRTPFISIRVYTGTSPQMIEYLNEEGESVSHFRFNVFTPSDRREFKIYHNVNMLRVRGSKRQIIISNNGEGYVLKQLKL